MLDRAPLYKTPNPDLAQDLGYAFAAISPDGGRNVYVIGANCIDCDGTYDPYYRTGVPCIWARGHAAITAANWGGHVQRIPITDLPQQLRP
ncbi:hypothetical protein [Planotetraspora phitsanulokensis]|uniref:Uncharacterized protein n=1 Tax=Planotetraspora phitsanulokensis TaxID=575192 RepID=A0A8J3UGJ0_9ACTN|nr:hypothetical protein [Planotetraspora phitsanulokensis]GII42886.1 hypothetical protein Pph01_78890 [Planotetraspora phitsanulokensis]